VRSSWFGVRNRNQVRCPKNRDSADHPEEAQDKLLKRAKNTAYRYLTIRSRSCSEIERKLRDREFPPDIVSTVIDHLRRLGYLNDEQFARDWAANRVRSRGFGRQRLEQELRFKGISSPIIRESLSTLFVDISEADIARKEADKKLKSLGRFEPEVRRRRLAGYLERKGFSSEIIRSLLRTVR
jgi:regulatory protein